MFIFRKIQEFFYSRQADILSAALILGGSALASRVLGLVRNWVLADHFAVEEIAIFFSAFRFPETFFEILVLGSLSSAFIPTFVSYLSKKKEEEGWRITGIVLNLTLGIFAALSALVFIFALPISRLIAPGFAEAEILLMSRLTRILIFTQGFFVLSFFLTGALKSYQRFVVPALAPVLYNLGIIGTTLLFARSWGIYAPVWGAVVGAFLHFAIQVPVAVRLGFRPVWSLNVNHPGVKRIIRLAAPRVAEIGFLQILKTAEVVFASLIGTASFTYLTFARSLEMIPVSLFGLSLADAALPVLSRRGRAFKKTFFSVFRQILFLTLPLAVAFAVLRIPLVRLAFGASRFTWSSTVETGYTLSMFALGIIGQALTIHFVRAFYALQDTDTPVLIGIADVVLNVALYAYFAVVLHLPTWGLALAFAISALVQAAVLGVLLIRRAELDIRGFLLPGIRIGLASLVSGSVMYVLLKVLDRSAWDKNLSFLGRWALPEPWPNFVLDTRYTLNLIILTAIVFLFGMGIYLLICRMLRVEEVGIISQAWRRISAFRKVKVPPAAIEDGR